MSDIQSREILPREILHVQRWLKEVVIELNFCPFAKAEVLKNAIKYSVSGEASIDKLLHELFNEFKYLDENNTTATTLVIYPDTAGLDDFDRYLDFVDLANDLLVESGYEGIYQLATFHPDYCFEGDAKDAASNYTNRSPYPIVHILRESSLESVLEKVPDAEKIPERNIRYANELGLAALKTRLQRCSE